MTATGSAGGIRNGGLLKSKRSSKGSEEASREPRAGRPKRASMNLRIDVWS